MKPKIIFITGSDTGVGKTVLAALLTRYLGEAGHRVVGLKPVCSGGRGDARVLRAAGGNVLTLDEVNPWHFRAPLAPLVAARREQRRLTMSEVTNYLRRMAAKFEVVVVEGAGGLLSPLGEGFDSRDLILAMRAKPIMVCPNRLGAVNQARLGLAALPRAVAARAQIVLSDLRPDSARTTNRQLLGELLGQRRVHHLPRVKELNPNPTRIRAFLAALAGQG